MGRPKRWELYFHDCPPQRGDERATWSRARLLAMDRRFVERMKRAIANGKERPQGEMSRVKGSRCAGNSCRLPSIPTDSCHSGASG
jgi:hypothetical protein